LQGVWLSLRAWQVACNFVSKKESLVLDKKKLFVSLLGLDVAETEVLVTSGRKIAV
jgi:hypothetical protein